MTAERVSVSRRAWAGVPTSGQLRPVTLLADGSTALFEKYTPAAREVLTDLLEKYAEHGPSQLHDLRVLEVQPLARHGSPVEIAGFFGGADGLRAAVSEIEQAIYSA